MRNTEDILEKDFYFDFSNIYLKNANLQKVIGSDSPGIILSKYVEACLTNKDKAFLFNQRKRIAKLNGL